MLVGTTTADDCEMQSDTTLVKIADDLFRSLWTDTSTAVVTGYTVESRRARTRRILISSTRCNCPDA